MVQVKTREKKSKEEKNETKRFSLGHSIDEIRGHELFLSDPQAVLNYHGQFGKKKKKDFPKSFKFFFSSKGYRRNTPGLRYRPIIGVRRVAGNGFIPDGRFSNITAGRPFEFA